MNQCSPENVNLVTLTDVSGDNLSGSCYQSQVKYLESYTTARQFNTETVPKGKGNTEWV